MQGAHLLAQVISFMAHAVLRVDVIRHEGYQCGKQHRGDTPANYPVPHRSPPGDDNFPNAFQVVPDIFYVLIDVVEAVFHVF